MFSKVCCKKVPGLEHAEERLQIQAGEVLAGGLRQQAQRPQTTQHKVEAVQAGAIKSADELSSLQRAILMKINN